MIKLKIPWAANSLKAVIVFLQLKKRMSDSQLLKPSSEKFLSFERGISQVKFD